MLTPLSLESLLSDQLRASRSSRKRRPNERKCSRPKSLLDRPKVPPPNAPRYNGAPPFYVKFKHVVIAFENPRANGAAECRTYIHERGKTGGARADLETLRAAINHHAKENLHYGSGRADLAGRRLPRHVGRDD
jgi:hypothetical protein